MATMLLTAAYGARYDTVSQMLAAWEAGEDFRIVGYSSYCSVRDIHRISSTFDNAYIISMQNPSIKLKVV